MECYLHLVLQIISSTGTFVALLLFGVTLLVAVKRGIKKVPVPYIILAAAAPWAFGACNAIPILTPVYELNATDIEGACFYTFNPIAGFVNIAFSWVVLALGACLCTVILALVAYCHVKKNSAERNPQQVLYRLAMFLVLSDLVLIAANLIVPTVYTVLSPEGLLQYYLSIILFPLTPWPSPISLITTYRPVRREVISKLKRIRQCCKVRIEQTEHNQ